MIRNVNGSSVGHRGLAQSEALRFGGFLIPEDRRSLLCASHATYSDALVPELLIAESFRSWWSSLIKVASRSTAVAAMIASGSLSRYCARKLTILSIGAGSVRPRPTTSTLSENSWKSLRSFSLRLGKAKNSI